MISTTVLAVLSRGHCRGTLYLLPEGQLDRTLYAGVNKVLEALGGKWNRKLGGHVFAADCEPLIENAIETGTYTDHKKELGWFPTPDRLAARLVSLADVQPGMTVLEPSAGEGAIVEHLFSGGPSKVYAVELDTHRCEKLIRKFPTLVVMRGDFLTAPIPERFNRIVMNPPFAKRADVHHVNHAYSLLADGGRLVAIMSAGIKFREDKLTRDLRERCRSIEELPAGSFKAAGTEVNTCIVILEK